MKAAALLVLLSQVALPDPVVPLPQAVLDVLSPSFRGMPNAVLPQHAVCADFDANGFEDWAILVRAGSRTASILVAYQFQDHWRAGNVDVWESAPGPVKVEVLPPGRYERQPPYNRPQQPNEREYVESIASGILVSFADKRRRAYQLGPHAWHYVYLGLAR
jgi:hypothetical protein